MEQLHEPAARSATAEIRLEALQMHHNHRAACGCTRHALMQCACFTYRCHIKQHSGSQTCPYTDQQEQTRM